MVQDAEVIGSPMERVMYETFPEEVGAALRRARRARGLTLRDVQRESLGAFKPSSLASYERGERAISVERFFRLTGLYGISPARLLADVSRRVEGRPSFRIDVLHLRSLGGVEAAALDGFIRNVLTLRRQPDADTISLRSGDLEVLATASGGRVDDFIEAIKAALRKE